VATAVELKRARGAAGAAGREEAQCRGDFLPEPVDAQADREFGTVGLNRIVEKGIEQLLVPIELQSTCARACSYDVNDRSDANDTRA